jgi:hypothetical protein
MTDEVYVLQYHGWGIEPDILSVRKDVTGSMADVEAHAKAIGRSTDGLQWEMPDEEGRRAYPHLVSRIPGLYTIERFKLGEKWEG